MQQKLILSGNENEEMDMKLNLKNRNRCTTLGLLCLMMLSVVGCKVYDKFTEPNLQSMTVTDVEVKLVEQSDEAARFDVTLTIRNPNTTPLPLGVADIALEVQDHGRASTRYLLHRTVPANAEQTVTVPVVIVTNTPVSAGTQYGTRGTVSYQPPGEFRKIMTDSKVPLPTVLFNTTGQF